MINNDTNNNPMNDDITIYEEPVTQYIDQIALGDGLMRGIEAYTSVDFSNAENDILYGKQDESHICFVYFRGNDDDLNLIYDLLRQHGSNYKNSPVDPL